MDDIDQSRFALMAVLTRAHDARPDEYPDPQALLALSDEGVRSYAAWAASSRSTASYAATALRAASSCLALRDSG